MTRTASPRCTCSRASAIPLTTDAGTSTGWLTPPPGITTTRPPASRPQPQPPARTLVRYSTARHLLRTKRNNGSSAVHHRFSLLVGVATPQPCTLTCGFRSLLPMSSTGRAPRRPEGDRSCRATSSARATSTTPSSTKGSTRSRAANNAVGIPPARTVPKLRCSSGASRRTVWPTGHRAGRASRWVST